MVSGMLSTAIYRVKYCSCHFHPGGICFCLGGGRKMSDVVVCSTYTIQYTTLFRMYCTTVFLLPSYSSDFAFFIVMSICSGFVFVCFVSVFIVMLYVFVSGFTALLLYVVVCCFVIVRCPLFIYKFYIYISVIITMTSIFQIYFLVIRLSFFILFPELPHYFMLSPLLLYYCMIIKP